MRGLISSLAAALLLNGAVAGTVSRRGTLNEAVVDAAKAATASGTGSAASPSPSASSGGKVTTAQSFSPIDVASKLMGLGFKAQGQNAKAANGQCWLGTDGANTNLVKNAASESIVVVVWGPMGSWMTDASKPPLITVGLQPGESTTISCGDISGGMAAVYGGTKISQWGQIDQTWVEFTFGSFGTVDVSREVNMNGNAVSVVGPKCTTDMSTCVFKCKSGSTCMDAGTYVLENCGTSIGGHSDAAAMNGGCLMGPSAKLTTTFS